SPPSIPSELPPHSRSPSPSTSRPSKRLKTDPSDPTIYFPSEYSAGMAFGRRLSRFERRRKMQERAGKMPWAPFADLDEAQLACWAIRSEMAHSDLDALLRLPITQSRTRPSFRNKGQFFKLVDELPHGPEFARRTVTVVGDLQDSDGKFLEEELEIWGRNPVDCIQEILQNPSHKGHDRYAPRKVYTDSTQTVREYGEMDTSDWWWETQFKIPKEGTVVPVILASDETKLTQFSGDKTALPIYITVGTIVKSVRRKPSSHATMLLGYLPTSKLKMYSESLRTSKGRDLFHFCMKRLLEPLVDAGKNGVMMQCPDGNDRWAFPILAAYIADHPEQCKVACTKANRCPKCKAAADALGNYPVDMPPIRTQQEALTILRGHCEGRAEALRPFEDEGWKDVYPPFWADLPHTNIFTCITPDLLHQVHKGVFKDHLLEWCSAIIGKDELDLRFHVMSSHPSLRHFAGGISGVSQWTAAVAKQAEKQFLGAIAGAISGPLLLATRALMDVILLAQYPTHTDKTLADLGDALAKFHQHKDAYVEAGGRMLPHFDIPKLHALLHYIMSIQQLGGLDGFSSESPERLHIDFAKKAYSASNKRDYTVQMTKWLARQEAVVMLESYLAWASPELTEEESEADDPEDSLSIMSDPDSMDIDAEDDDLALPPSHYLAKVPPFPKVPVPVLSQHFGAKAFCACLERFLAENVPPALIRRAPRISDCFAVYK
ncbi:hypothetical protein BOTBODRAFT_96113, partial [Botryobasidium botryosum FD-172 SS1]